MKKNLKSIFVIIIGLALIAGLASCRKPKQDDAASTPLGTTEGTGAKEETTDVSEETTASTKESTADAAETPAEGNTTEEAETILSEETATPAETTT